MLSPTSQPPVQRLPGAFLCSKTGTSASSGFDADQAPNPGLRGDNPWVETNSVKSVMHATAFHRHQGGSTKQSCSVSPPDFVPILIPACRFRPRMVGQHITERHGYATMLVGWTAGLSSFGWVFPAMPESPGSPDKAKHSFSASGVRWNSVSVGWSHGCRVGIAPARQA